jgi:hypothetical protein
MQPSEIVVAVIRSAKPDVERSGWQAEEEGSRRSPGTTGTLVATSSSAATGANGAKTL